MKKLYENPTVTLTDFNVKDIITTSPTQGYGYVFRWDEGVGVDDGSGL